MSVNIFLSCCTCWNRSPFIHIAAGTQCIVRDKYRHLSLFLNTSDDNFLLNWTHDNFHCHGTTMDKYAHTKHCQSQQIEITNPFLERPFSRAKGERNVNALNAKHFCKTQNTECRRQKICNMLFEWLKRDAKLFHTQRHSFPAVLLCSVLSCGCTTYAEQENWKWIYENWKWHLNADHFIFICVPVHLVFAHTIYLMQYTSCLQPYNVTIKQKAYPSLSTITTFNSSCCIATNNQRRLILNLSLH